MRSTLRFVLLLAAASCVDPRSNEVAESSSTIVAAPDARWLGVLDSGRTTCPAPPGGWALATRSGALSRFCEYQFTASAADPTADPNDLLDGDVEKLDDAEQGLVFGRAGSTSEEQAFMNIMSASLFPLFAYHLDLPAAPALLPASRSRLAIVDSMPEGAPAPRSIHAPMLAGIARAAACAGDACAIDLAHHLALPRVEGGTIDLINGGHYGTLWELAQAIVEAVQAARDGDAPSLVINLSVGWDSQARPDLPPDHLAIVKGSDQTISAPERAVHTAIVYARCSGALIFAATGNDDVGLQDRAGPLLPAGWAVHRAPSAAECSAMFGLEVRDSGAENHPLVYPVGGVDHRDALLENARVDSTPELVAPSSAVTYPGASYILTGTSVGTLVTSAASAIVWSIRPELSADDVYAIVRSTAVPIDIAASFCPSGACESARRLSLCRAEAAACEARDDCAPLSCAPGGVPAPGIRPLSMFLEAATHVLQARALTFLAHDSPAPVAGCGSLRLISGSAPPLECPFNTPIAARNLDSGPQPTDPMCPACSVLDRPEAVWLMMRLVAEIPGDRILNPFLVVKSGPTLSMRYQLPGPFWEGHQEVFQLPPTGWQTRITSAWLVYDIIREGQRFAAGGPVLLE